MRLIVLFDLPTYSNKDLTEYRKFRQFLLKNGFIMMQESVYCKIVLNNNSTKLLKTQIVKNLPSSGLVQLMQITEKQFADIEYLVGKAQTKIIDSIDRVVSI